ncbi:WGR domain-containing protein [Rhizobium leguminosarum]|uniref:Putative DNA-binding WGR domain protein n=1 Tax=Rhizobium leguminosarum TaxID=384 RepID=A0A7W9ZMX4_RHILE|nr:WGR domain-containing protein [Rhizobium leguminosarum]MBB6219636.1 putative DNA-binding WGR domain protein [Rhizobium leguminosarum]
MVLNRDRWETAIRGYPIGSNARNPLLLMFGASPPIRLRLSPPTCRAQDRQLSLVPPPLTPITAGGGHGRRDSRAARCITDVNRSAMTDSGNSLDGELLNSQDPIMDAQADFTLLYQIDPSRNLARFYRLSIQPTLFGGSSLVRNWGRIGTDGRLKVDLFDTPSEAANACERMADCKLRRGYRMSGNCPPREGSLRRKVRGLLPEASWNRQRWRNRARSARPDELTSCSRLRRLPQIYCSDGTGEVGVSEQVGNAMS